VHRISIHSESQYVKDKVLIRRTYVAISSDELRQVGSNSGIEKFRNVGMLECLNWRIGICEICVICGWDWGMNRMIGRVEIGGWKSDVRSQRSAVGGWRIGWMIRMNGCGNAGMRGWEELIEKLCAFVALCENQGSGVRGWRAEGGELGEDWDDCGWMR